MGNVFADIRKGAASLKTVAPKAFEFGVVRPIRQVGSETERTARTVERFFKGPEPIKPEPIREPAPLPTVQQEEAGESARLRARRRRGRRQTIVTGALVPPATRKTVLG